MRADAPQANAMPLALRRPHVLTGVVVAFGLQTALAQTPALAADAAALARSQRIQELLLDHARLEARLAELEKLEYEAGLPVRATVPSDDHRRQLQAYSEEELETVHARIAMVNGTDALDAAAAVMTQAVIKIGDLSTCLDYFWLLFSGSAVMLMQAGFAILEAGSCRSKNGGMLLLKNVADACLGTIAWYIVGYGLAYGVSDDPNEILGTQNFLGADFMTTASDEAESLTGTHHFRDWFFQWAFCATAATIVSGSLAERVRFPAYAGYSVFMTGWVYPVVVYWTWTSGGWLSKNGYSDFAGSGIVHLLGGTSALVAAILVGARKGRWEEPGKFVPHNMGLVVMGTFVLWFGWYGFNCGSTLAFSDISTATQATLVAMNTTLSAATGGLTVFALRMRQKTYDLAGMCNGILAGLVACCAGVADFKPEGALATGFLGGLAYEIGHVTVLALKIDDPLDAFSVHGCGGMVGVLVRPLFDRTGAKGDMFKWHIYGLLSIVAWSGIWTFAALAPLRWLGLLRAPEEEEDVGGDSLLSPRRMYVIKTEDQAVPLVDSDAGGAHSAAKVMEEEGTHMRCALLENEDIAPTIIGAPAQPEVDDFDIAGISWDAPVEHLPKTVSKSFAPQLEEANPPHA